MIDEKEMARARGAAVPARASRQQSWSNAGAAAAGTWVSDLGLTVPSGTRWHIEIQLDVVETRAPSQFDESTATRFHLDIYSEEWGFYFCHAGQCSWIRVTDVPFVHGRDDFKLLDLAPPLTEIGQLVRELEQRFSIRLRRDLALIRTNLPKAEPAVRSWIATL
jgi:hypothetical protein